MKSLYTEQAKLTAEGATLDIEVHDFLETIYAKYIEMGYGPREISHVINNANIHEEFVSIIK